MKMYERSVFMYECLISLEKNEDSLAFAVSAKFLGKSELLSIEIDFYFISIE